MRTQSHQPSMSTLCYGQTRKTCPFPVPKIRHSPIHTRAGWLTPIKVQHHPDLSPSHSVYRHTTPPTRTRWHPREQILRTCMQSFGSPIPHKTRIQHRGSSVDRQMGLRRHQEVHTRLTTDETTTYIPDQDRRSHQTIGTGPNDEILQSILDHTQLLGYHTHTRHSRDLHRQQEMALHLRMVLWNIHLQEVLQQAISEPMPQVFSLRRRSRSTGVRHLRIRH